MIRTSAKTAMVAATLSLFALFGATTHAQTTSTLPAVSAEQAVDTVSIDTLRSGNTPQKGTN